MSHLCPECGLEHGDVVEEVVADPAVPEAAVVIAEIEAERDVTLARIAAKSGEDERESRIAALEGEMRGMRDMLERLLPPEREPAPEPVPVVVEPTPEPAMAEPVAEPPPMAEPITRKTKAGNAFWR